MGTLKHIPSSQTSPSRMLDLVQMSLLGAVVSCPRECRVRGLQLPLCKARCLSHEVVTQGQPIFRDCGRPNGAVSGSNQSFGLQARARPVVGQSELRIEESQIRMAVDRERNARPDLKIGVRGEHADDPTSVAFLAKAGVNYVSCSVPRMHHARLAAAQAALEDNSNPPPTFVNPAASDVSSRETNRKPDVTPISLED
jgi:hypothetical protein